jgi:hypothetical protein
VIDREDIQLKPEFFATDFKEIDQEVLYKMSLDSFIDCLLEKIRMITGILSELIKPKISIIKKKKQLDRVAFYM